MAPKKRIGQKYFKTAHFLAGFFPETSNREIQSKEKQKKNGRSVPVP